MPQALTPYDLSSRARILVEHPKPFENRLWRNGQIAAEYRAHLNGTAPCSSACLRAWQEKTGGRR
jgi:hypothetical protein